GLRLARRLALCLGLAVGLGARLRACLRVRLRLRSHLGFGGRRVLGLGCRFWRGLGGFGVGPRLGSGIRFGVRNRLGCRRRSQPQNSREDQEARPAVLSDHSSMFLPRPKSRRSPQTYCFDKVDETLIVRNRGDVETMIPVCDVTAAIPAISVNG